MSELKRILCSDPDYNEKYAHMTVEERINAFLEEVDINAKHTVKEYSKWFYILTKACIFGRTGFIQTHGYKLEDEYTVDEFIKVVKGAYKSNIINRLEQAIKDRRLHNG